MSLNDGDAGSLIGGGGDHWPPRMLLEVSFRLCLRGDPLWLVLQTLLAQMARLLQVAPLACVRRGLQVFTSLDPLEHSVLDYAGPDGRHVAVDPVGPFRTLSSSDCHGPLSAQMICLLDDAGSLIGGGGGGGGSLSPSFYKGSGPC